MCHSVHYQLRSNMLEHINCMKTLCDQLNEMTYTITDKQLACDLLVNLRLGKYKVLTISLDMQCEDNLQFDRLKYQLLQSSGHEAFSDSTANLTFQNQMSEYNHWVTGKLVN